MYIDFSQMSKNIYSESINVKFWKSNGKIVWD